MKGSTAYSPCGTGPRSLPFSGKHNQKVSKRTTEPNQNTPKRENYPRKYWAMKRKPNLQWRALFLLPPQALTPRGLVFPSPQHKPGSVLGAHAAAAPEKLVTQWCAQMLMPWLFWNKSDTKCEQKQTAIWPQKWCSQECLGSCSGKCGIYTALSRSCNIMHMVTPHVPQTAGSVYSMLHVLLRLHNHRERHFKRQGSGLKFGAPGPGLNWAKSVAMQVYWIGGKKEDPMQCMPRTSHRCL